MIGLPKGTVKLLPHNPMWVTLANDMITLLHPLFKEDTIIEHIGSTSIPSIQAKPIIDIALGVSSFKEIECVLDKLHQIGFVYHQTIGGDDLMYFNKKNDHSFTTYHLHGCIKTSQPFKNHLYFRDYLKNHKDVAKDYESLKVKLANQYPKDRPQYTYEKESMIQHIIRKAQVDHFLGKNISVKIDRPIGATHPKHSTIHYPINYGYIEGEFAPDKEELDVYVLDLDIPVHTCDGRVIAIIHRENDVEDKLVMTTSNRFYSKNEIKEITDFQEQFYISTIEHYKYE